MLELRRRARGDRQVPGVRRSEAGQGRAPMLALQRGHAPHDLQRLPGAGRGSGPLRAASRAVIVVNTVELRARFDLTQGELASLLEVSGATVARWEAGNAAPSRGPSRTMLSALDLCTLTSAELRTLRAGRLRGAGFELWARVFGSAAVRMHRDRGGA